MNIDIVPIRDAWRGLSDLVAIMSCGHVLEEEEPYTLDRVEERCRRFLEEYDEYKQRQK